MVLWFNMHKKPVAPLKTNAKITVGPLYSTNKTTCSALSERTHEVREGAKCIETGAGYSGTGAVTFLTP